jgi:hypothetical protein
VLARAYFELGRTRYESGDTDGAAADFAKALADPNLEPELRKTAADLAKALAAPNLRKMLFHT